MEHAVSILEVLEQHGYSIEYVLSGAAAACVYTVQLYFDFSGYSDMAVGLGLMMNIELPFNFNSPYKAYGMIDYWNRWHMSLTHAITNYIYTPIVMSFREITFAKAMLATFAAMLIAGIWHGLGLVLNHVWKKYKLWMPKPFGYVLMWGLILTANVFFRAESVGDAVKVLYAIVGGNGIAWPMKIVNFAKHFGVTLTYSGYTFISNKCILLSAIAIIFLCPNSINLLKKFRPSWMAVVFVLCLAVASLYNFSQITDFLYLRF